MYGDISRPDTAHFQAAQQAELGRQARQSLPRSAARECVIPERDPLDLLRAQDATRLQDLVPLRYGRMSVDPFRFYRGTAGIMAHDLESQPNTGVEVVACGDAHLSNFGFYASPERNLVFDLNDFDEAAPAPWEWDVKRLAASVVLAARQEGASAKTCERLARQITGAYRETIRRLALTPLLERYYQSVRDDELTADLSGRARAELDRVRRKATRRTSAQAARKMLEPTSTGGVRFREQPPVLTHVNDDLRDALSDLFTQYASSTRPDIAVLLSGCRLVDVARRVVGVGSVGTRCFVVALLGPVGEPIILQVKEAQQSVLVQHRAEHRLPRLHLISRRFPEGRRVVACQQILQSVSDSFLGWLSYNNHDYYVRQFRDMKGSFDVDSMDPGVLLRYGRACATMLARAHSQSPTCAWIAGYLGKSDAFDRAVAGWSVEYADQAEVDFDRLKSAISTGAVPVLEG
ncbi:MAG: DUF2252 domain-containing protein [Microbacteriaceae bacterium]|jgi:uncharacterized protein (DUF2252 family)|nr:DUF2252 domain-containing protein [Microbacteriaceae bacterium]